MTIRSIRDIPARTCPAACPAACSRFGRKSPTYGGFLTHFRLWLKFYQVVVDKTTVFQEAGCLQSPSPTAPISGKFEQYTVFNKNTLAVCPYYRYTCFSFFNSMLASVQLLFMSRFNRLWAFFHSSLGHSVTQIGFAWLY